MEDVRKIMSEHGVSRAVLVQHLGEYDNSYIENVVARDPDRFAGVFLIGDVPSATAILDRFLNHAEVITITGRSCRLKDQAKNADSKKNSPRKAARGNSSCQERRIEVYEVLYHWSILSCPVTWLKRGLPCRKWEVSDALLLWPYPSACLGPRPR